MKLTKRLTIVCLAIALVLSVALLLQPTTNAQASTTVGGIEFTQPFTAANLSGSSNKNISASGNYYLEDDLDLSSISSSIYIGSGKVVNLDLNGHVLNMGGYGFNVYQGNSELNIYDSNPNGTSHVFYSDAEHPNYYISSEGLTNPTTTVVKGGVIYSQGSGMSCPTFYAYGWYSEGQGTATIRLNGGTVINPEGYALYLGLAESKIIMNGGAVRGSLVAVKYNPNYADKQVFEMNGGVISDNHASGDPLIENEKCLELRLLGGEITNNTMADVSNGYGLIRTFARNNVVIGNCRIANNTLIAKSGASTYGTIIWQEATDESTGTFTLKGKPYIADNVAIAANGTVTPSNLYLYDSSRVNKQIDTSELAFNATVNVSGIGGNLPTASNPKTFTCANTSNLIGAIESDNPTYGLKLGPNNEVMLCVASEAQAPFGVKLAGTFSGDEIALLTESNMETYEERRVTAGANELALDSLSMNLTDADVEFNAYFLVTLNPGINALVLNLDYETDIFELATDGTGAYKLSATSLLGGVDGECTVTGTETDAEGIKLEFDALNNDSSLSTSSSSYLVCATFTLKSGLTQSEVEGKHEITFDDDSYAAYVSGESATGTTLTNVCKVTTIPAVVYIRKTASISIDETKVTYDASAKNFAWAPSGTVGTDFVGRYECAGATEGATQLIASTYSTSLHSDTWYSYADSTYTKITADEGNIINAGTYYVKASADQNKEYMAVGEDYYPVVISPRNLTITAQAIPESKQYTGSAITWAITEFSALSDDRLPADSTLELYTVAGVLANSYTDVGEYTAQVCFLLGDNHNYAFITTDEFGGEVAYLSAYFDATVKISKAPNNWVTGHIPADVTRDYNAEAFEPAYQAEFGTPEILYSTDNNVFTELTANCILNAGTYYIKASVPADADGNYDGVDETTITYVINKVTLGSDFALNYSVDGEVSWASITNDSKGNTLPYDCVVLYYIDETQQDSTTFAPSASGTYVLYATPTDTTNYVGSSIDLKTVYAITFAEGSHEKLEEEALSFYIKGPKETKPDYVTQYRFEDQKVTEPTDPSLSKGYTFKHWANDATEYDFATAVESDLTLTAIWELKSVTVVWSNAEGNALTITEDIPEGTTVDEEGTITQTYYFGDTVAYPGNTPTKDADAKSYTFSKWQDSTSLADLDVETFVIDDVEFGYTFVAIYDETLNEFYVTFIVYNEFGAVVGSYTTVEKLRVGTQLSGYVSEFGEYAWYKLMYWYESKDSENKVFSSKVLILPEPTDEQKDDEEFVKEVYGYYKFDIGTGDVSGDGIINAPGDITTYRQWIVGGYTMTVVGNGNEWNTVCDSSTKANIYSSETKYFLLRTADTNTDEARDIRDVTTIRMAIVGGYGYYINVGYNVTGEEISPIRQDTVYNLIREVNLALSVAETPTTMHDALAIVKESCEFDLAEIDAADVIILYDSVNSVFCCYEITTDTIVTPGSQVDQSQVKPWQYWQFVDNTSATPTATVEGKGWSLYLRNNNQASLTVNTGIDAGNCTGITSISYINNADGATAKEVVIRTNSYETKLTIDAPTDVIRHYDVCGSVNIIASHTASYHEYGKVPFVEIAKGRIALEAGAEVTQLHFDATEQQDFNEIIVAIAPTVEAPKFSRDEANIKETGTLVVELQKDTNNDENTDSDYVWLFKQGVISQIVVTSNEVEGIQKNASDGKYYGYTSSEAQKEEVTLGVSEKSTETQKAAVEIANNYTGSHSTVQTIGGAENVIVAELDENGDIKTEVGKTLAETIAEAVQEAGLDQTAKETAKEEIVTEVVNEEVIAEDTDYVARIGTTGYKTLEEAADAADGVSVTVVLLQDIDFSDKYTAGGFHEFIFEDDIVDLNGHSISNRNASIVFDGDNMLVKNGKFIGTNGASYGLFVGDGIYGDRISTGIILQDLEFVGGVNVFAAEVTIREMIATTTASAETYYAVWADEAGYITVESGTFQSLSTIGGKVIHAYDGTGKNPGEPGLVTIKGGTYIALNDAVEMCGAGPEFIQICGGTFNRDPSANVVDGYKAVDNGDGTWTVVEVEKTYIGTAQELQAFALVGGYGVLTDDITLTSVVRIDKSATLDLANHTINGSLWLGTKAVTEEKHFVVKNGTIYTETELTGLGVFGSNTTAEIRNVKATGYYYGISTNGTDNTFDTQSQEYASSLTITDCEFYATNSYDSSAVYFPAGYVYTVTDSKFVGGCGITVKGGRSTLTNCEITANGYYCAPAKNGNGAVGLGMALDIQQTDGYSCPIELTATDCTLSSKEAGHEVSFINYSEESATTISVNGVSYTAETTGYTATIIRTTQQLLSKVDVGGYLVLDANIDLAGQKARFTKDVYINLCGFSITNGDLGVLKASEGVHFTIVNGTVNAGAVTNSSFGLSLAGNAITAEIKNVHAVGYYGGIATNGMQSNVTITALDSHFEGTCNTDSTAAYLPAGGNSSFTNCKFTGATAVGVKSGNNNFTDCEFVVTGEHVAPVKSTSGIASCGVGVAVQPTDGYNLPVHVRLEDCEFSGCDAQYEIEYVNFSSVETSTVVVVEDGDETPITAIEPNA